MKQKKLDIKLLFALLCLFCLGFLSTRHAINGHGIAESTNAEVLAQTGTTGNGGTGGGTPIVIPPCVTKDDGKGVPSKPDIVGEYTITTQLKCEGKSGSCMAGERVDFYDQDNNLWRSDPGKKSVNCK